MPIKRVVSLLTAAGLILVVFLLVNPGCASTPDHAGLGLMTIEQMQESVENTVSDPERARQVVALLDALKAAMIEYQQGVLEGRRALFALNAARESSIAPGRLTSAASQAAALNAQASNPAISQLPIQAPRAVSRLVQPLITQMPAAQNSAIHWAYTLASTNHGQSGKLPRPSPTRITATWVMTITASSSRHVQNDGG